MHATISLVSEVTKLPSGSPFQARLESPIKVNGRTVLPKGTMFEGHLRTVHARYLIRPGSVLMMFEQTVLPDGSVQPLHANLVSPGNDAIQTDVEGKLRPKTSKRRLLIQLGGTGLAAKFADDLAQLLGGTALSATKARFAGLGVASTFLVIQKGREVKLRVGDHLDVEFGGEMAVPIYSSAPAVA